MMVSKLLYHLRHLFTAYGYMQTHQPILNLYGGIYFVIISFIYLNLWVCIDLCSLNNANNIKLVFTAFFIFLVPVLVNLDKDVFDTLKTVTLENSVC